MENKNLEDMIAELEEYYECAGFADFYERVFKDMTDDEEETTNMAAIMKCEQAQHGDNALSGHDIGERMQEFKIVDDFSPIKAIVKCDQAQKQKIKETLLKRIRSMMHVIRRDENDVSVKETEEGLFVDYPIGEIYGYSSVYVEAIAYLFEDLKKKYPSIEVQGIAYEYETIVDATYGPFFYCKSTDADLTVTFDWQKCAWCGRIIENDAIYNSSEKDGMEGNRLCLCSPTCMLEYSLKNRNRWSWMEVRGNASLTEEEHAEIDGNEDRKVIKNILWNRIVASMTENSYVEDFTMNKSRILALLDSHDLDYEKKTVLKTILALIG